MLDDLHQALVAQDWPTALERALAAWRDTRIPELADLIDRITVRCTLPEPGQEVPAEQHLWWVQHAAKRPGSVMIGALLARLAHRADALDANVTTVRQRWRSAASNPLTAHLSANNRWPTNFQERCAILLDWPDDPRVARTLVEVVQSQHVPHAYGIAELFDLLGDRVGEIGDVRVLPALQLMIDEPRGGNVDRRANQVRFARHAKGVLEMHRVHISPAITARLPACVALLPPPPEPPQDPPRPDLDALWAEVAAQPDDVATRSVLGDALTLAGDPRGDLIVLQCNSKNPKRPLRGTNRDVYDGRVKTLLRRQWKHWLGDLSLVLPRRVCEFRCGMLEVATVGSAATPSWAYAKARGHRELACLHTVRPGWVSDQDYATFVAALPRVPRTLAVASPGVFDELASRGVAFEGLHTLELVRSPMTHPDNVPRRDWAGSSLRDGLGRIGALAPGIHTVIVRDHVIARMFPPLGPDLRRLLPGLRTLAVDEPTRLVVPELVADRTFEVAPAVR